MLMNTDGRAIEGIRAGCANPEIAKEEKGETFCCESVVSFAMMGSGLGMSCEWD